MRGDRENRGKGKAMRSKIALGDPLQQNKEELIPTWELYLPRDVKKLDLLSHGRPAHNHTVHSSNWRKTHLSGASGEVVW